MTVRADIEQQAAENASQSPKDPDRYINDPRIIGRVEHAGVVEGECVDEGESQHQVYGRRVSAGKSQNIPVVAGSGATLLSRAHSLRTVLSDVRVTRGRVWCSRLLY